MKRLTVISGLLMAVLLLVTISCRAAKESTTVPTPTPTPAPTPAPRPPSVGASKGGIQDLSPSISSAQDRMIIRNGNISLVVKDITDTRDKINQLAAILEGYVVSSSISGQEQQTRGHITIRIPDSKFDQALVALRAMAVRVQSESTSSQDVTEQYVDLQARLKVAQATESQYLALLEKANTVEETLNIYNALSQVQQQIEQIKGQMQYLERLSAMSLISISLQPVGTTGALVAAGWSALETLKSAIRGIVIFGQWLANIAIWLLIFLPIWGTILGIVIWRLRRRRVARSSPPLK